MDSAFTSHTFRLLFTKAIVQMLQDKEVGLSCVCLLTYLENVAILCQLSKTVSNLFNVKQLLLIGLKAESNFDKELLHMERKGLFL